MANIIKAGSTSAGLTVTPDQSGILDIRTGQAAGGVTALTIDASQNVALAANATVAGNLTVTGNITGTLTSGLGVGQTWQTVTRVSNTNYTNTTSKPIAVSTWVVNLPTNNSVTLFVDNVAVASQGNATGTSGWTVPMFTIVPPNSVYKIIATAGTIVCAELR